MAFAVVIKNQAFNSNNVCVAHSQHYKAERVHLNTSVARGLPLSEEKKSRVSVSSKWMSLFRDGNFTTCLPFLFLSYAPLPQNLGSKTFLPQTSHKSQVQRLLENSPQVV